MGAGRLTGDDLREMVGLLGSGRAADVSIKWREMLRAIIRRVFVVSDYVKEWIWEDGLQRS